ncbi:MAG: hypothetical protein KDD51_01270 [Bdellovibrionales bacterium]|nr:hypothetical protein [Bdellovibrionales bacterium]
MKKLHFFRLLVCGVALASAQLLADSGQIFRSQSGQFLVRQVSQFSSLVQIDLLARAPLPLRFQFQRRKPRVLSWLLS